MPLPPRFGQIRQTHQVGKFVKHPFAVGGEHDADAGMYNRRKLADKFYLHGGVEV